MHFFLYFQKQSAIIFVHLHHIIMMYFVKYFRKIILLTTLALMMFPPSTAQEVTISGNAAEYVGCVLTFYSIDNYFSNNEIKMAECTVPANGHFMLRFPCRDVRLIYTYLGIFQVRLFVEPGCNYEVMLPQRIDKLPEEAESPFFEEVPVKMNILSVSDSNGLKVAFEKELNFMIYKFDEIFNPLYDQLAVDAARRCPVAYLDASIHYFREQLPRTDNHYFNRYAFYRSGLLYYAAQRGGIKQISNEYFARQPVLYNNTAYMELFNATYDKYFMYFGRSVDAIYEVINRQGSFSGLKRLLAQDGMLLTDSLCEAVILKNIHDEFYADRFSRRALLHLLDSAMVHTKIERHRELSGDIRSKITKLLRGFEPPPFELYNQDSTLVSLQDYRGKYVYLMFCTTQNYVCLQQYRLIEDLYRRHHKWLSIVVVSVDEHLSEMRSFRQKSGCQWDFLHFANDPDILKKYDVRIFPTGYFIDPEGKLVLSPAPAAEDQLERTMWLELNSIGLWQEYIRQGMITLD